MKKILITGAAGCVGRQLVEKLLAETEHHIFATDVKPNPFQSQPEQNALRLEYLSLDIRDNTFTDWVIERKPDVVIHLASILQISERMPRETAYEIDVVGTERLLAACITAKVSKIIVTTSGAAYGYYPSNKEIITEQRPTSGNADYFYSAHKAAVEVLMRRYRGIHPELEQIVFRPGAILGPDFEGPVVNLFQQKAITGLMGYPGPFNFIWSEDVVDYLIEGAQSNITGQFNIAGDGTMSMKEIADYLQKRYIALPAWLVQGVLAIAKPLGLSQYGPEQVKFIKFRPVLSNEKLKRHFQHQPRYNSRQTLDAFLASQQNTSSPLPSSAIQENSHA
ncbi:NAD-dependent epimerase/dehydratase family protein [Maricurvus nonylphenolicus]|uniref:NAD-dependent epimerase/dehydratase family protein n=1 Tax=Maricurvus nonylphenolicus TaxID=1008307 RepID=UPI0036F28146